ncbi:hypothetical protein BHYA_0183g00040 [Botrytis hyacinthi]|uniref:Uncharacterized protein n=1 Tax=Botrytis hyacinthi TaxID=278943 RepID=A0A4Z1GH56_9HELO|nr:hypothetical protein BHYA_0183g00040 [Botrytis hyacinthi]
MFLDVFRNDNAINIKPISESWIKETYPQVISIKSQAICLTVKSSTQAPSAITLRPQLTIIDA